MTVRTEWLCLLLMSAAASAQVPYDRLVRAQDEPQNWLTYSGNYAGHRYSRLEQINPQNVAGLQMAWALQLPSGTSETSPLVVDGVLYLTGPNYAFAIEGRTGRKLWSWNRPLPERFRMNGFGAVNRGPAVLDDKLYVGALDGVLVALDLATGAERWTASVADWHQGYAITVAPLAAAGKVIVGVSGGEAGVRGFLDAYDSQTGRRVWRFYTVPGAGERGVETWAGDSWRTGGGPTWVTGSFDPESQLLYWGVGNPAPDWNGDSRLGDNLYTCSLLALDVGTGTLRWHFQFTPHDVHDWDANHVPILFDAKVGGIARKLIGVANRNAFYYVLDRTTGAFLSATPFARQSWNGGFDANGRPKVLPGSEPTEAGTVVSPNWNGATLWPSSSFSPRTRMVYVPARDSSARYFKRETPFEEGAYFLGGGAEHIPFEEHRSAIRALDSVTGALRWEFTLLTPPWAGVLSTAGDLVFSGSDEGLFYALDARRGTLLWNARLGGRITANPISFAIDGRQYVAIAADRVFYVFALPETSVGGALTASSREPANAVAKCPKRLEDP